MADVPVSPLLQVIVNGPTPLEMFTCAFPSGELKHEVLTIDSTVNTAPPLEPTDVAEVFEHDD